MADPPTDRQAGPGGPRQLRRVAQSALGRTHVLDAAEEVFARKGFHAATIKDIARAAEFSVGAVYGFVASKDDLFDQVVDRRVAGLVGELREALAPAAGTPIGGLHALVDAWIGFLRDHPALGPLWAASSSEPERTGPVTALLVDFFRAGQRSGQLVEGPPEVLAETLVAMILAFDGRASPGRASGMTDRDAASGDSQNAESGVSPAWLHALVDRAFTVTR